MDSRQSFASTRKRRAASPMQALPGRDGVECREPANGRYPSQGRLFGVEGQGRSRFGAADPVFETGGQAVLTKTCPPVRLGLFGRRREPRPEMDPRTLAFAFGRESDVATGGRSRRGRRLVGWGSLSEGARCKAVAPVVL
jgi:hypothetical protein